MPITMALNRTLNVDTVDVTVTGQFNVGAASGMNCVSKNPGVSRAGISPGCMIIHQCCDVNTVTNT